MAYAVENLRLIRQRRDQAWPVRWGGKVPGWCGRRLAQKRALPGMRRHGVAARKRARAFTGSLCAPAKEKPRYLKDSGVVFFGAGEMNRTGLRDSAIDA